MSQKLSLCVLLLGVLSLNTPAMAQDHSHSSSSHDAHSDHDSHADHDASDSDATHGTPSAHVHGEAHLTMAIDAQSLVMELEVPLDSLVGFEHKPTNDTETKALAQAHDLLAKADALFKLNEAAECILTSAEIDMPSFEAGAHADVDAEYQYQCDAPERISSLEVSLFQSFERIEVLKTIYLSDDKQLAATLTPDNTTFALR